MKTIRHGAAVAAFAGLALFVAADASAYRMIQNTSPIRTSTGTRVLCNDPGGFVHWTRSSITFRVNPANQGGEAGVTGAIQGALDSWTAVTPAGYQLSQGASTNAGFVTDGVNTLLWAAGNGCSGGCLAITALVLGPGQVIHEADVSFNNLHNWNTNGGDYDLQAIAAHEVGHCLGIHHTEITKPRNRPTMYASYFGTGGRTLEADDRDALNCAANRYPPSSAVIELASLLPQDPLEPDVRLASNTRAGHATLRFALREPGHVRLEVFDVAGRRMATLLDESRGAGEHEVAWDGASARGSASRGVYFARLETPQGRATATLIVGL